ncbi:M56 family metallopeptidase [Nostocaceae cyanobacterium CENA369]|uniref:M56 family metallopeptidase n=1 Tax=Dendronalium phyllosphericum CENA369 TaxID=1725256 RepID=A0A8J7IDY0_9NOST|nr:M56 family metallopeptidase [Dendronalium phyllosphericum]MBH8577598.1 M56 family metallopeptidase [Dendronalium phyllosphericum CENA369]
MHLLMVVMALILAWYLRSQWSSPIGNWMERFPRALLLFLLPPLLLLTTTFAVFCMGPHGHIMVWGWEGWVSYGLAISFLGFAGVLWLKLVWEGNRMLKQIRTYPIIYVYGTPARLLNVPVVYCALVGFWKPELIISQGLLDTLDSVHLKAVLAHEDGHRHYHDTCWFFFLGWLRQLTSWLPHTESLWQELLLLREIRADYWAARQVDSLLLAEALLLVVNTPVLLESNFCAAFAQHISTNHVTQRIDALLQEPNSMGTPKPWSWVWLILVLVPLLVIPFHS